MFPDSKIAKQFQMGKSKASYLICHGLALYFKERLLNVLNEPISIGTCSLHIVDRAFQNAENSTIWNIKE